MRFGHFSFVTAGLVLGSAVTVAAFAAKASLYVYYINNAAGEKVGTVKFTDSKKGVKMKVSLHGVPFGPHGVHVHTVASCEGPDFKSAGGHFNPDAHKHGFQNPDGHHAGDTPDNLYVGEDHNGEATFLMPGLSLDPAAANSIFANGGTSLVIHEKADDMMTDPSGNSGNRIACAVIKS